MNITDYINLTGIVLSLIGSILLGISLNTYLTSMHGALAIHDMQITAMLTQSDKVIVAGVGELLTKGVKDSRIKTKWGFIFLIAGFIVQIIPFVLLIIKKSN